MVVKIPNARDQPQFGSVFLLDMEKKTSESPPNKNDNAKKIDSANNELKGEVKTMKLNITNSNPTIKGIYQCFTEFLIESKNDVFIIFF